MAEATIEAHAADGSIHVFPDGTADAVIDRVMKTYARQRRNAAPASLEDSSTDQAEMLAEAYRRGLLPRDRAEMYREAMMRGLVPKIGAPEIRQANSRPADSMLMSAAKGAAEGFGRTVLQGQDYVGRGLSAVGATGAGGWLERDAQAGMAKLRNETAPDRAAHPIATGLAEAGGAIVVPGGVASRLARGAGAVGAIGGAISGVLEHEPGQPNALYQMLARGAEGAAVGAVAGKAGEYLERGASAAYHGMAGWLSRNAPEALHDRAVQKLMARFEHDEAGSGPSAQQAMETVNAARAAGKPMALADVAGKNVQGLAGSVARAPGPSKAFIEQTIQGRAAEAGSRLSRDVAQHLTSGPTMRQTAGALTAGQRAAAAPLYEQAFAGGSVAPLESQMQSIVADATKREAAAQKVITTSEGYLGRLKEGDASARIYHRDRISLAAKDIRAAQADKAKAAEVLAQARADKSAGLRGAVWSPRVQQFLDDPIIKQGIGKGIDIQRLESLAEGRSFDPKDYALTGMDEAGKPVAGKVPNMRLLDAAKKGLDSIIEGYREPVTGRLNLDERGRAVDEVRRAFVSELDRLNPDYKAARAAWAGPAEAKGALTAGRAIFSRHPEDIARSFGALSPANRELYRVGAADALRDALAKGGVTAPQIRGLAHGSHNSMVKEQLRPLFPTQEKFEAFLRAVTDERTMFERGNKVLGGSQTAERVEEDGANRLSAAGHGMAAIGHAANGNALSALLGIMKAKRDLGVRNDPNMNMALAKLLFSSTAQLDSKASGGTKLLARAAQHLPATRNHLARFLGPLAGELGAHNASGR